MHFLQALFTCSALMSRKLQKAFLLFVSPFDQIGHHEACNENRLKLFKSFKRQPWKPLVSFVGLFGWTWVLSISVHLAVITLIEVKAENAGQED